MNIGGLASISSNSAPRQTVINGQPHMLSYINPQEAELLKRLGGSGRPSIAGIPAFYQDDAADSGTGPGSSSSDNDNDPSTNMGLDSSISDMTEVSAGMGATSSSGDPGIGPVDFGLGPFGGFGPNVSMGNTMTDTNFSGNQGYNPGDVTSTNLGVGGYTDLGTGRNTNTNLGYAINNFFNNLQPKDFAKFGINALSLVPNPVQPIAQMISKGMTIADLANIAKGDRSGVLGSVVGGLENTIGTLSQPDLGSITESLGAQARGE